MEAVREPFLRGLEDNKEDLALTRVEPSQEGTLLCYCLQEEGLASRGQGERETSVYTCVPFENQEGKVNGYFLKPSFLYPVYSPGKITEAQGAGGGGEGFGCSILSRSSRSLCTHVVG